MHKTWIVVLSTALLPIASSADRPAELDGGFTLASTNLEHVQKDANGREVLREIQHFTPDGFLSGTTTWTHDFTNGRPSRSVRVTKNALAETTERMTEERTYSKRGLKRIIREWENADGLLTRHEEAVYSRDDKAKTTLITTTVRNGLRELLETRYTVLTNVRNQLHSTDTSVFNADNVQTSRHLTEWTRLQVERWSFDQQDEVVRHEVESLQRDDKGRIVSSTTDIFGAGRELTGARDRRMNYDGPNGNLSLSVTTWYDGNEQALQRETVRHAHERGTITRRVRWEHWVDTTP